MKTGETGTTHITYGSIFDDREVLETGHGAELKALSRLLTGLQGWLKQSDLSTAAVAQLLEVTPAQVTLIQRGRIHALDIGLLVRMAARAGLKPEVRLTLPGKCGCDGDGCG